MTALAPMSESLAVRIQRQKERCALCDADGELARCFDPDDPGAGVFEACSDCVDDYRLESYGDYE